MKLISALILSFISLSARSGINVIDKGGGFAEMLVLKIDNNLSKTIESCVLQPSYCEVLEEDLKTLRSLQVTLPDLQATKFEFVSACSSQIDISRSSITIPSCLLYGKNNQNEVPLNVQELSEIVISTRLTQGKLEPLKKESIDKLFFRFYLEDDIYELSNGIKAVAVHVTEYGSSWYQKDFLLSVETSVATTDLTLRLQSLLCGSNKLTELKMGFDRNLFLNPERFLFEGESQWKCSSSFQEEFKGKISLSGIIDRDQNIRDDSVSIQLRQRERMWY